MSVNLIDSVRSLFTPEIVNKASTYLGENEPNVAKAFNAIVPVIFAGLASKASTSDGANTVAQMAQQQNHSGILDNISSLFSTENGGLMNKAFGFINNLFGNKSDDLTNTVADFSGIKKTSASSLLAMATPVVLSFLGNHGADHKLNAGGLASVLNNQKHYMADAIPAGFNLQSIFGHTETISTAPVRPIPATQYEEVPPSGGAIKWLLPLLLIALLAAAALYFFKDGCKSNDTNTVATDTTGATSVMQDTTEKITPPATTSGTVDSLGNFIYNVGNTVVIDLPNNTGKLEVGENSTEAKLVRFLIDKNAAVDTAKGNWFEFTNVRFKSGSSVITEESMIQLKNMVLITKAFPEARFKIGGYTDNTGNEASNVQLSKSRAAVVAAKLKSLGAAAASIVSSDGYGSQFPVGDNNTAEGKAQNRRVSVNVKAK